VPRAAAMPAGPSTGTAGLANRDSPPATTDATSRTTSSSVATPASGTK
jgi:hypothetical protein